MKNKIQISSLLCCGLMLILVRVGYEDEISVIHRTTGERITSLNAIRAGAYDFVSLQDLARTLNLPASQDALLKQFQINSRKTIFFMAMNPFIRVNEEIRQMPIAVLFQNNHFYAPIKFLLPCIQDALPFPLEYNEERREIYISAFHADIQGLTFEDKQNGVMIRLRLSAYIPIANIYTSESNGWFYLDVYGGQILNVEHILMEGNSRIVSQTMKVQLSKDTARFGFQLNRSIKEKTISQQDNPFQITLSLRTREEVSVDLLADLAREREKWKIDLVVIDPGHGGKDPGTIGKSGYYEKYLTLAIAKEIKAELERLLKIKVVLTRDSDVFVPLQERTQFANRQNGKLFISIHADSNPDDGLRGHTVFFMGPAKTDEARRVAQYENSVIEYEDSKKKYAGMSDAAFILAANAQNSFNKESQDFADLVDKQLGKSAQSRSIGVRQAGFYVLYGASMPNLLVETGFASNRQDEKRLKDKNNQRLIAKAIAAGVKEFKDRYEMVN
jgi:N-acetylmuramoyl-L-alanine amidase